MFTCFHCHWIVSFQISFKEQQLHLQPSSHCHHGALSPVLRGRHSLGVAGQSGFLLYGVDGNKQVTWLHPPSGPVKRSTVQTICRRKTQQQQPERKGAKRDGMRINFWKNNNNWGRNGRLGSNIENLRERKKKNKTNLDRLLLLLWDFQSKFSDNVPAHKEKQTIVSTLTRVPSLAPALQRRLNCFCFGLRAETKQQQKKNSAGQNTESFFSYSFSL